MTRINLNYWVRLFVSGFIFLNISSSYSQSICDSRFPDALSIANTSSTLTLASGANVSASPDNILDTILSNFDSASSCGSGVCGKSNTVVPAVTYTGGFPGSGNLIASSAAPNNFSPGNYGSFASGSNRSMSFATGTYTFSQVWSFFHNVTVSIANAGTVRLFFKSDIRIGRDVKINTAGGANRLLIYTNGNVTIDTGANVNAVIYAKGFITTAADSTYNGALTSEGNLTLAANSTATFDQTMVDNIDYNGLCPAGPEPVASFDFNVSTTTASACFPIEATITARDNNGDIITDYAGAINLSASPADGDWSKTASASNANGVLSPGALDSGAASYTFDSSDNGQIILNYAYDRVGSVNLTVSGDGITAQANNINFAESRFVFTDASGYNKDMVAHRPTTFTVQLWKYDVAPVEGNQCGINTNYNATTIKTWIRRNFDDAGGVTPSLTNNNNATITPPATIPASPNFTVNFVNGEATVTLLPTDVGSLELQFADESNTFAGDRIPGTTGVMTVRPFGFDITVPNNPGASDHTGGAFKRAGETFSVTVRAVGWQAADDMDNDGIPDNHTSDTDPTNNANLSDNPTLVSFGNEATPERVRLRGFKRIHEPNTSNVLVNSSGSGSASIFSAFTNGVSTRNDVRYGDVGILELEASILGDEYIEAAKATTVKMNSRLGYVGRFYPFEFTLSNVSITPACSSGVPFTYFGQPLAVSATIQAKNSFGNMLGNYYGDFAKLTGTDSDVSFSVVNQDNSDNLSTRFTILDATPIPWSASGGSEADINLRIQETRQQPPQAPLTQLEIGILPTDSDGVTVAASDLNFDANNDASNDFVSLGTFELRYGRLILANAFSSEVVDLPAPFYTEYFTGSHWQLHADDSCTTIPFADITYPSGTIDAVSNRTITVGGGQTTGSYVQTDATSVLFNGGQTQHSFSAPGAGNTGTFSTQIDLTNRLWLSFDWNADGDHNEVILKPATYTFGSYRGHDRVIYWQENLE